MAEGRCKECDSQPLVDGLAPEGRGNSLDGDAIRYCSESANSIDGKYALPWAKGGCGGWWPRGALAFCLLSSLWAASLCVASDADAGSATTNRATTYQGRDANFTANISGDSQDKTNAWAFHGQQGDPEEWSRRADINSELEFDARTSLRLRNSARDQRDLKEESIGSFFLNYSNEWEEKRVNDTQVTAGFFDDQLRFVSSYSVSRFSGDDTDGNVETGSQHQQGVAFEPWRSEDVGVVLFSTYGATEAGYQDLSLSSDDKKLQNPFADSSLFADRGFSALRFGGEARFGPGNVTLAQTQSWDETEAGHAKNEYQAGVKFDVTDAAQRFGYAPDGFAEAILPSTLWLDYGLGREVSEDIDGPESRSTDMSLGGAWGWGDVYSEVSYWTSFFDNMKPDERGKDSEEQG